jgi:hypothetical protein
MSRTDVDRLTWYILGVGTVLVCTVLALFSAEAAVSATVGAVVALANWFLLRFIVGRVFDSGVRRQAVFSVVLFVKLGGLIALVFFLLRSGLVLPVPFTIGVSSLALGTLLGSLAHILQPPPIEDEG